MDDYKEALGKEILSVAIVGDDTLEIIFTDDSKLRVVDEGQSCCERRYMNTDDDVDYYAGSIFTGLDVDSGGYHNQTEDEYDVEETQFMKVHTSRGTFTVVNYNAHNGFYGGFSIRTYYRKGVT